MDLTYLLSSQRRKCFSLLLSSHVHSVFLPRCKHISIEQIVDIFNTDNLSLEYFKDLYIRKLQKYSGLRTIIEYKITIRSRNVPKNLYDYFT